MADMARERLRAVEDGFTERKREGAGSAELRKTLVAFANSVPEFRTGVLFIGVSNDGQIRGVENPDGLQKKLRMYAEKDCYPPIPVSLEVISVDGKDVVAVIVPHSSTRPHFAGPAYVRVGSESVAASAPQYEELIASRHSLANRLLGLKGGVVTVLALRRPLGQVHKPTDPSYRRQHEARVEACDAHHVRMFDISTSTNVSEPLSSIRVSFDEERHRPMLIVEPA